MTVFLVALSVIVGFCVVIAILIHHDLNDVE